MIGKSAPVSFGTVSMDQTTVLVGGIVLVIVLALALGLRREMATFALFAGVIGVMLAI